MCRLLRHGGFGLPALSLLFQVGIAHGLIRWTCGRGPESTGG